MNMMTQFNHNQQSMTSLDISELVQSRHDKVKQSIERLAERGVITLPPMGEKATAGRPTTFYVFSGEQGKRDSIIVVAQLCPEFTAALVDRWAELENQKPAELSRMDLIKLALAAEEENIALKQYVAVLEPKAEALETIADTTNTYCLRECAKTIGIKESELIKLLIDKKWIYRDADRKLQPHAQYVLNKVFTNRTSPVITNQNDGRERVFLHMRVTAFGLTRITGLVNKVRKAQQVAA
ncbi:DNA-binding protein [Acinetobacter sp. ANC 3781]|uniref:phage antirepressor KilAC domain-containing protein n=1 Tax=Acinetobacter sp. ANC 3781 TaxID=2529835 RepID=UPI00103AE775|nr:phage antirepressor KilAC domain-containing protein [Acinetobacter sp. ANC 3781]TCB80167.1 DNA-binding protein [Acinetobacter sp. ANC 3781]